MKWEYLATFKKYSSGYTSSIETTVVKLTDGEVVVYLVPYGEDYECEGGHHIKDMTPTEFEKEFSLERK